MAGCKNSDFATCAPTRISPKGKKLEEGGHFSCTVHSSARLRRARPDFAPIFNTLCGELKPAQPPKSPLRWPIPPQPFGAGRGGQICSSSSTSLPVSNRSRPSALASSRPYLPLAIKSASACPAP